MTQPAALLAQLDTQIGEASALLAQLERRRLDADEVPGATTKEPRPDLSTKPEKIRGTPTETPPKLPAIIEVKISGAKGYGYMAKKINKQMAVFPDWQPLKAKTLRSRMGGQMLHSKTYTFKPAELLGSEFLDGGVKGKALKRAIQAGKAWRNGGRKKYLAKKKAERTAKEKALAEAKAAEEAAQAEAEAEDDALRKSWEEENGIGQSMEDPDVLALAAEKAAVEEYDRKQAEAQAAEDARKEDCSRMEPGQTMVDTPLHGSQPVPPSERDMMTSRNGVTIPRDLQESEMIAHHFAYMDAERNPDTGELTGRLRTCDESELGTDSEATCMTPTDKAWLKEHDYVEPTVLVDEKTQLQAVILSTGAQRQQSYPGMKKPHLSVRGTVGDVFEAGEVGPDWQNNAQQNSPGENKYVANHEALRQATRQLHDATGQKVNTSGHSQGLAVVAQMAADDGHGENHIINAVHGFQGAGAPQSSVNRFTRNHGPGSNEEIEVYNVSATDDMVDRSGLQLPGRNIVIEQDGDGIMAGHTQKDLTSNYENKVVEDQVTHRSLREPGLEAARRDLATVLDTHADAVEITAGAMSGDVGAAYNQVLGSQGKPVYRMDDHDQILTNADRVEQRQEALDAHPGRTKEATATIMDSPSQKELDDHAIVSEIRSRPGGIPSTAKVSSEGFHD